MFVLLNKISDNIWIYDGSTVPFLGLPFSTRMTIVRLLSGELWIHSPEIICSQLQEELQQLGNVKYVISPNKLHHLFLSEWVEKYPKAEYYAAPGLIKKRSDINFTKELSNTSDLEWNSEINQIVFQGSPIMEEVVFFHVASRTLILTDLIENFNPNVFNWWQTVVARLTGVVSPNGKTPIDWRISFIFGKKKAKQALRKIVEWKPDNIIISHGECIIGDGLNFLNKSFKWLDKSA